MVVRYEVTGHDHEMLEANDGEYVSYDDYKMLEQYIKRKVEFELAVDTEDEWDRGFDSAMRCVLKWIEDCNKGVQ